MKRKAKPAKNMDKVSIERNFTVDHSPGKQAYNPFPSLIYLKNILGESLQKKKTFFTYLVYDYAFIQVSCAPYLRTLICCYIKPLKENFLLLLKNGLQK